MSEQVDRPPESVPQVAEQDDDEVVDGEIVDDLILSLERDRDRPVQQGELANILRRTTRISRSHRGPLPTTEYMREISEIVPNGAERIMAMAEREQAHRHEIETRQTGLFETVASNDHDVARRGQRYGFFIALFVIGVAAILALMDHARIAALLAAVDVVGLAAVFVVGRYTGPRDGDSVPADEDSTGDGKPGTPEIDAS